MKPALFFRFDASPGIGLGHLRRCAALAAECRRRGAGIRCFARWRDLDLDKAGLPAGAEVSEVPWDLDAADEARWLAEQCRAEGVMTGVLDHYRLDENYQVTLREADLRWMQFGNRAHAHPLWGELLHDASPGAAREHYGERLRLPSTRLLFGPEFALLNPEFARMRVPIQGEADVDSVLVTFGGGNDRGAVLRALGWLEAAGFPGQVEVLTTSLNPSLGAILERAERASRVTVHVDNWSPAEVMARCQLAITGGGTTLHELASLGVPALVLSLAGNQRAPGQAWGKAGLGAFLGDVETMDDKTAVEQVSLWLRETALRITAAQRCMQVQDGLGTRRVAEALIELAGSIHRDT